MSIYYQDDYVTLYHGDCLTEHRGWLNADVLVTDPPYGISYESNRVKGRKPPLIIGDSDTCARDDVLLAWGDSPALMFGTWKVPRPISTNQVLIWDKWGGGGTVGSPSSPWAYSHEEIYILGRWPKLQPGGRKREGGSPSRGSGVLRVANYNTQHASRPKHPTPKPVALMELLIGKCPSGTVADPFAGSGATLIAAKNLGRRAIGVEIEEKYCEIIATRCQQEAFDLGDVA